MVIHGNNHGAMTGSSFQSIAVVVDFTSRKDGDRAKAAASLCQGSAGWYSELAKLVTNYYNYGG